jgi:hypothetical protein
MRVCVDMALEALVSSLVNAARLPTDLIFTRIKSIRSADLEPTENRCLAGADFVLVGDRME